MKQRVIPSENQSYTESRLDVYSKVGLRILVLAMREISGEEWRRFHEEKQLLTNDPSRDKLIRLFQILISVEKAANLEKNLNLIGATAIEDQLQNNVPQVIADLIRASNFLRE